MSVGNAGYGAVVRLTAFGRLPLHVERDAVAVDVDLRAGLARACRSTASSVSGRVAARGDAAAGHRAGDQEGAGFDAVGQHVVLAAVQALDAVHDDATGAGAFDLRAHRD